MKWKRFARFCALISLIFLLLSLGCAAAAPVSAGGRRAAAKAGATEVQHGQRSVGRRKCETSDDFLFWPDKIFGWDASVRRRNLSRAYRIPHSARLQEELKRKLSERNKLLTEYEVRPFITYTVMDFLFTRM